MSEYATFLKVGTTSILLAMLEDSSTVLHNDLTLERPDPGHTARSATTSPASAGSAWAKGAEMRALDIQAEYLERALKFRDRKGPLARGGHRLST